MQFAAERVKPPAKMEHLFSYRCILLFGFILNNVLVSQPLQTKVRPSGKWVLFWPKGKSVTALLKKWTRMDAPASFSALA